MATKPKTGSSSKIVIHDLNEKGYNVQELYDKLQAVINANQGSRRVFIGPTGGEDLNTPIAISIVGVEANFDGEEDICWLYPSGDNEWV